MNHSRNKAIIGIAIVALIYLLQIVVMMALADPLNQSVLAIIIYPTILVVGWLVCGLVLGATIFNLAIGGRRFVYGLLIAILISAVSAVIFINIISKGNYGGL